MSPTRSHSAWKPPPVDPVSLAATPAPSGGPAGTLDRLIGALTGLQI